MNHDDLQNMFGKEPSKIYIFTGSIEDGKEPVEEITLDFARAAGTNLIDAVVTKINQTWVVYTRNTTVDDNNFSLYVELPLPEPEEIVPEQTELDPAEEGQ
jgi:hypothetical protein